MSRVKKKIPFDIFEEVLQDCIDKVERTNTLDWQDIVNKHGLNINPDVIRKAVASPLGAYPVYNFMKSKIESGVDDSELLKEIEEKKLELEKERKKLQATKIEYNKLVRADSRRELFYENIADTIERLPLPNFEPIKYENSGDGEYILSWADIHYGATFDFPVEMVNIFTF